MPLIYVIPQSHCAIVERFGRFSRVQKAGIRFKIPLIERLIDLDPWGETAHKDGWIIEVVPCFDQYSLDKVFELVRQLMHRPLVLGPS